LTVDEVIAAVRAQNAQVTAGRGRPAAFNAAHAFQLGIGPKAACKHRKNFATSSLKTTIEAGSPGWRSGACRTRAQDYSINAYLSASLRSRSA